MWRDTSDNAESMHLAVGFNIGTRLAQQFRSRRILRADALSWLPKSECDRNADLRLQPEAAHMRRGTGASSAKFFGTRIEPHLRIGNEIRTPRRDHERKRCEVRDSRQSSRQCRGCAADGSCNGLRHRTAWRRPRRVALQVLRYGRVGAHQRARGVRRHTATACNLKIALHIGAVNADRLPD